MLIATVCNWKMMNWGKNRTDDFLGMSTGRMGSKIVIISE
jgi:hypothetical protein